MTVRQTSKRELTSALQERYCRASRQGKGQILIAPAHIPTVPTTTNPLRIPSCTHQRHHITAPISDTLRSGRHMRQRLPESQIF
jgi:hypothetical protein